MRYYKLLNQAQFIGVCSSQEFCKFQEKRCILLQSDEESGQYVQYNDGLYRDGWMSPVITDKLQFSKVEIIEIGEHEYNALMSAIEKNEEIFEPVEEEVAEEPEYDEDLDVAMDFMKKSKIAEMSSECNRIITNGFNVLLSDGNYHHFSLTIQDQLNLITLSTMVASGEKVIPYHADGELCKGYTVEDISAILDTATNFKTYHVTYFNSLKLYIDSLESIEEIRNVGYGSEIPEKYQSEILKMLMENSK